MMCCHVAPLQLSSLATVIVCTDSVLIWRRVWLREHCGCAHVDHLPLAGSPRRRTTPPRSAHSIAEAEGAQACGKQITSLVTDLSKVASTVVALTELTESTAESTAESQKRIEAKQAHFEVLLSAVGVGASLKSTKKHFELLSNDAGGELGEAKKGMKLAHDQKKEVCD